VFGDVGVKRQQLECELQLLDEKESESSLSDEDALGGRSVSLSLRR
jgi:hypothetical protein